MATWGRAGLGALSYCTFLGACGCYAGAVGIGLGVAAGTGGGGGGRANDPPRAKVAVAERLAGGKVRVGFSVSDDDAGFIDVAVEWQPEEQGLLRDPGRKGEWLPAHPASEEGIERGARLPVEANASREFDYLWTAKPDLQSVLEKDGVPVTEAAVFVRITPRQGRRIGQSSVEEDRREGRSVVSYRVGNSLPEVRSISADPLNRIPADLKILKGPILLAVNLWDSMDDAVTLEGFYRAGPAGEKRKMKLRLDRGVTGSEGDGQENLLVWESETELDLEPGLAGRASDEVHVEFRAKDEMEDQFGPAMELGPVVVDNNLSPTVEFPEQKGPTDKSFQIPIRFVLKDEDAPDPGGQLNKVSVILQWAAAEEDFKDLPLGGTVVRQADLSRLEGLLGEKGDPGDRLDARILSAAAVKLRGILDVPDDPSQLDVTQIRETDLVREGLVFHPPNQKGLVPLDDPPAEGLREDSDVFLVGREIRLFDAAGTFDQTSRIVGFDSRTSVATVNPPRPADLPPGTRYEILLTSGMTALSSRSAGADKKGGSQHTFLWDSLKDMRESGTDFSSAIRVRAVAFNSDLRAGVGDPPVEEALMELDLGNDLLVAGKLVEIAANSRPIWVTIHDVNGDGRGEVFVLNEGPRTVSVFRDTAGRLDTLGEPLITGDDPRMVAVGNVHGDQAVEVLVANAGSSSVTVYSQAAGSFDPVATLSLDSETDRPLSLALGDVDGDGRQDVVVAHELSAEVRVYRQDETGGLGIPLPLGRGHRFRNYAVETPDGDNELFQTVAAGDLNGDGKDDVVVVNAHARKAFVYFQKPDPIPEDSTRRLPLQPDQVINTGSRPVFVTIEDVIKDPAGDVSGASFKDILIASVAPTETIATVNVYRKERTSDSFFGLSPSLGFTKDAGATSPVVLAVGDVDSDGKRDILATDPDLDAVHVFLQGESGFRLGPSFRLNTGSRSSPRSVATGNVKGDARDEVAVVTFDDGMLHVYRQESFEEFPAVEEQPPSLPLPGKFVALSVGDVSADGERNVVVLSQSLADAGRGRVTVYRQALERGKVTLDVEKTPKNADKTFVTLESPASMAIGDMNGDGRNDVVVATRDVKDAGAVTVYAQDPSGVLAPGAPVVTTAPEPSLVTVGDSNGDGRNDMLVLAQAPKDVGTATLYLQDSDGLFTERIESLETADTPRSASLGDANGDGRVDAVVGGASRVSAYLREATGSLPSAPARTLSPGNGPFFVAVGDLTGDGRSDLIVLHTSSLSPSLAFPGASVYVQDPSGEWKPEVQALITGSGPSWADIGDLNGDGRNDIVIVTRVSDATEIYLQGADGTFPSRPSQELEADGFPAWVELGDLNGDWRSDIVVAHAVVPPRDGYTLRMYLAR